MDSKKMQRMLCFAVLALIVVRRFLSTSNAMLALFLMLAVNGLLFFLGVIWMRRANGGLKIFYLVFLLVIAWDTISRFI